MYGYIYETTNLINGKKYIGRHKSSEFDESYFGSGKIITQALKKDGEENFSCIILDCADSEEELNEKEAFYIEMFNAVEDGSYYNLKPGGIGKSVGGFVIINNGQVHKYVQPDEVEEYLQKGFVIGKLPDSEETIQKRADSNRGKKRTEQQRKNISNSLKGRKLSEEHRKKCFNGRLGKPSYNKGQVQMFKDDAYVFIDKENITNYLEQGFQFGGKKHSKPSARKDKIAVCKDNHIEYINPKDLQIYLEDGYVKGTNRTRILNNYVKHHWYNNGTDNILISEDCDVPPGYVRGRLIPDEQKQKFSKVNVGKTPWNKGLTKETDERVLRNTEARKQTLTNKKLRESMETP